MRNTWIVVTDLEELKAYRVDSDPLYSNPRLELVDHARTTANRRLVEEVTDQAGRFPRTGVGPNGVGGMARGERHNMELEKRKRCIRKLADHLNSLLRSDEVERCFLAASREIQRVAAGNRPAVARQGGSGCGRGPDQCPEIRTVGVLQVRSNRGSPVSVAFGEAGNPPAERPTGVTPQEPPGRDERITRSAPSGRSPIRGMDPEARAGPQARTRPPAAERREGTPTQGAMPHSGNASGRPSPLRPTQPARQ